MFNPGDYIHYGTSGLCRVEEIMKPDFSGVDRNRLYYRLTPLEGHGSTIYTPVDNQKVSMRRAISREDASSLIDELPHIDQLVVEDEKRAEQIFKDALSSPECRDWISLIKTLYLRRRVRTQQGKKVTATEDRYYQAALEQFHSEIGLALDIEKDDVETYITERLEKV